MGKSYFCCLLIKALSHQSVEILTLPVDINKGDMKKRILKKSDLLREGYVKGLKKAQRIIKEMLEQSEDNLPSTVTVSGEGCDDEFNAVWFAECEYEHHIEDCFDIAFNDE